MIPAQLIKTFPFSSRFATVAVSDLLAFANTSENFALFSGFEQETKFNDGVNGEGHTIAISTDRKSLSALSTVTPSSHRVFDTTKNPPVLLSTDTVSAPNAQDTIAYDPTGRFAALGSVSNGLVVYDMLNNVVLTNVGEQPTAGSIVCVAFHPTNGHLLVASNNRILRKYTINTANNTVNFVTGGNITLTITPIWMSVAFNHVLIFGAAADTYLFVVYYVDAGQTNVYSVQGTYVDHTVPWVTSRGAVATVSEITGLAIVAVVSSDPASTRRLRLFTHIWGTAPIDQSANIDTQPHGAIHHVAFTADGHRLYIGGDTNANGDMQCYDITYTPIGPNQSNASAKLVTRSGALTGSKTYTGISLAERPKPWVMSIFYNWSTAGGSFCAYKGLEFGKALTIPAPLAGSNTNTYRVRFSLTNRKFCVTNTQSNASTVVICNVDKVSGAITYDKTINFGTGSILGNSCFSPSDNIIAIFDANTNVTGVPRIQIRDIASGNQLPISGTVPIGSTGGVFDGYFHPTNNVMYAYVAQQRAIYMYSYNDSGATYLGQFILSRTAITNNIIFNQYGFYVFYSGATGGFFDYYEYGTDAVPVFVKAATASSSTLQMDQRSFAVSPNNRFVACSPSTTGPLYVYDNLTNAAAPITNIPLNVQMRFVDNETIIYRELTNNNLTVMVKYVNGTWLLLHNKGTMAANGYYYGEYTIMDPPDNLTMPVQPLLTITVTPQSVAAGGLPAGTFVLSSMFAISGLGASTATLIARIGNTVFGYPAIGYIAANSDLNTPLPTNTPIPISDLNSYSYVSGATIGKDWLQLTADNGNSNQAIGFVTLNYAAPIMTALSVGTLNRNDTRTFAQLFSISNPAGAPPIVSVTVTNTGTSGYLTDASNNVIPANTPVTAASLGQITYHSNDAGSDTLTAYASRADVNSNTASNIINNSGLFPNVLPDEVIYDSGSGVATVPTVFNEITIEVWGGGSSGIGYSRDTVVPPNVAWLAGNNGGNSTCAGMTAGGAIAGPGGGAGVVNVPQGSPGTASGGNVANIVGNRGNPGYTSNSGSNGMGAGAPNGGGNITPITGNAQGVQGSIPGGGGGGWFQASTSIGSGGHSGGYTKSVFYWGDLIPGSSLPWSVGAGGAASPVTPPYIIVSRSGAGRNGRVKISWK
jgi:hypothetical protein